jgi:D-aspartate ligase
MRHLQTPGAVVLGSDFKALGLIRSLGRRGIPCVVFDNLPRSAWFSRYVGRRFKWTGPMDTEAFVSFLLRVGTAYSLERWLLFPAQDEVVELVARHTAQLAPFYHLVTQDWSIVQWANDKRLTYRMAEQLGLPYPKTWYPAGEADLQTLGAVFPVIIKPAISTHLQYGLRLKALPAANRDELLAQYRLAARTISPDEIMVQEIIPGDGRAQYSVAAFCKEGRMLASMTARRTRQYPVHYGLGSSFVEALEVPALVPLAERIVAAMGVSGMVEVEFKQDHRDEQYKLLDINVRPWGWHTLCSACGLDFSYMQYCDALGKPLDYRARPSYRHHWVRLITDIPAGVQEIREGRTTPGAYLRSLRGKTVFSVLDWRDPLPVCGDAASVLWRALRGSHTKNAIKDKERWEETLQKAPEVS